MVVPYVNKIENPNEKYLVDLDDQMSSILVQKNLPIDEKVKLYSQTLTKYLVNYDDKYTGNKNTINNNAIETDLKDIKQEITKIKTEPIDQSDIKTNLNQIIQEIKNTKTEPIDQTDIKSNLNEIMQEIKNNKDLTNDKTLNKVKQDINALKKEIFKEPKRKVPKKSTNNDQPFTFSSDIIPKFIPSNNIINNDEPMAMDQSFASPIKKTTRSNTDNKFQLTPMLNLSPDRIAKFENFKKNLQQPNLKIDKDQKFDHINNLQLNLEKNIKKINQFSNLPNNLNNSNLQQQINQKLETIKKDHTHYTDLINKAGSGLYQKGGCKWMSKKFF